MTDINDNVDKLKRFLQDQGHELTELENGLQLRWDSGHVIEINALTRDSDYFWASMETTNADPDQRRMEINSVHESLAASLDGLATLGSFEQTQDADDQFVYVANVELDPSVVYYGAIDMDDLSATEWAAPPSHGKQIQRRQEPTVEMKKAARKTMSPEKLEPAAKKRPAAKPRAEAISRKTESSGEKTKPTPGKPSDPIASARTVVAQLETIDGKMIRQSLDMMNLRRSSSIRLMLTRIFRSAVDPEELMQSIREEAEKIVTDEDRKELEIVRVMSENGFLEPVVNLLYREVEKRA
ncbi:MAG: hypothetical protein C4548_04060 [Desulfobacteraceae bacterium]|jgi:hypothetical protein|nr:MAG: hypothetical protein C4548_04060 [Desulfobacteraceae bacterium]